MRKNYVCLVAQRKIPPMLHIDFSGNMNWFPSYMNWTTKKIAVIADRVDFLLEVRDCRLPLSTANYILDEMIPLNKRVIVLNKTDLVQQEDADQSVAYLKSQGFNVALTTAGGRQVETSSVSSMQNFVRNLVISLNLKKRFNSLPFIGVVVGIPNVGKSSIINQLRQCSPNRSNLAIKKVKAAEVGYSPGVTLRMTRFEVCTDPHCTILDSPGVMVPRIKSFEQGIKLALVGAIKEGVIPTEDVCQYLLNVLNDNELQNKYQYKYRCSYSERWSDLAPRVTASCYQVDRRQDYDPQEAAAHFLSDFRKGILGLPIIDLLPTSCSQSQSSANNEWRRNFQKQQQLNASDACNNSKTTTTTTTTAVQQSKQNVCVTNNNQNNNQNNTKNKKKSDDEMLLEEKLSPLQRQRLQRHTLLLQQQQQRQT